MTARSPDTALVNLSLISYLICQTFIGLPHVPRPNRLNSILGLSWDTISLFSFHFLVRYFTRTFIICTASNILMVNFCIPLRLWIINTSSLLSLTWRCGPRDPGVDELDVVQRLLLAQQVFVTAGVTHLQT